MKKLTGYPFTTVVAEQFGKKTEAPTPVVESTGTGGGIKLFCAGVGDNTPDAVNASRPIKDTELNNILLKKVIHEEIVEFCKNVLKELNNRTWQLKEYMSWERFVGGQ